MSETSTRRQQHGGPPLGVLAVLSTALFLLGLFVAAAMAGRFMPAPTASAQTIQDYFQNNRSAVRVAALFQFGAAVPLAIYAATVSARLHNLGIRAPGATIALVGGVLSSVMLAISGLISWVLSRAEVVHASPLVRALQDFCYMTGGPGNVVFLGLLLAGIAVPAFFARLLPRPLVAVGLVLAVIAELSTLSIIADGAGYLLPIARFPALAWLVVAGFLLPRTRRRTVPEAAGSRTRDTALAR
jgi:hypothetical protein